MTEEQRKLHGKFNYRIHTAIDMIKVGMVLDEMVAAGVIEQAEATTLDRLASSVLATIGNANNRGFGLPTRPPVT